MNTNDLKNKLNSQFSDKVEIDHFEKKEWFADSTTKQTWKSKLQRTFSVRYKEKSVKNEIRTEIEKFLRQLEEFDENNTLYSFSAVSEDYYYGGWIIDSNIVYCIPKRIGA